MTTARSIALLAFLSLTGAASAFFGQQAFAQQASADGEKLFRTRCGSCHGVQAGQNRIGPPLAGVVGRQAASVPGARYSDALRASGLVWDEQSLDRYLANPRQTVPGTTMTATVPDAGQRTAIIAYLRGLPGAE